MAMQKLPGKVLVAQGGGPTAVINQSLVGVVLEARKFSHITRVYGAQHGVTGIVGENLLDLTRETTHNLEQVARTQSSALLSTRAKPDEEMCSRMFQVMKNHGVHYFFYVGGNDSADTVRIVNQQADDAGYPLRCVHIPKTIDNDLVENDHTPGFGSAARFVGQAFQGVNLDNRALGGVYIGIIMGRHAGFLAASSCLGRKYVDDGPHLIYVPERAFDPDKFVADVEEVYSRLGRCIVAVSEGISDKDGKAIISRLKPDMGSDDHGNVQLSGTGVLGDLLMDYVKTHTSIKRVRADTFGYLQRSFAGCVSDRDAHEAREVGEKAVQYAIWDDVDGSVVIRRPVLDYSVDYELVPLEKVAAKTKLMDPSFINEAGNHVTQAYHGYVRPLVGSAFPEPHRLRAPRVPTQGLGPS
ncbi:6-phosphofructokinase [Planctomycetota bacterium]|nr:6-phosphofructokinase [Planctomycetota bacterium]